MRLLRERFLGLQAVRYSIVDSGLGQLKRILSAEDRPVGCRSLELLVGEQREGGRRRRWRRRRRRRRSGQIRQTECLSLPSAMHVLQHKDRDRVLCTEVIGLECVRHALVYRHRGGYLVRVGFEYSKEGGSVGKSVNRRAHCVVCPTRCPLTSTQILTETNSPVEQCTELLCIDCSYAKSFVSARSIAFTHRYCNTIYICVCGKGGTKEAALRRVVEKSKGKDVDNSLVTLPKRLETDPIRMESERQKGLRNIGALEMEK